MQITLHEATELFTRCGDRGVPMVFVSDLRVSVPGSAPLVLKRGTLFSAEVAGLLEQAAAPGVDLVFNDRLVANLVNLFPDRYRLPFGQLNFIEMDRMLESLKELNRRSQRKREVVTLTEVYRKEGNALSVLLEYGETIEYAKWNDVKTKLDKRQVLDYRTSECGIIVLVDLRPGGDNYLQRFYRNSDLVTSLVGRRKEETVLVAPDFNRETDVWTVDDPSKLLETYVAKNARLVIVGDTLSQDYKNALARVKNYDRYARFMLATNIDQSHLDEFLKQVQKSYLSDNFNLDDFG